MAEIRTMTRAAADEAATSRVKTIVVCSDGTGNADIKGRGTNVFKLFEAIDLNGHRTDATLDPQVALYDDGVGTEDFKPLKILGGATGFGLSKNVRKLYRELARIYDPGDRIFLFGFSRGAFTVRTLAGLIGTCGILDVERLDTAADLKRAVRAAYRIYRQRYQTPLERLLGGAVDEQAVRAFRAGHCHPGPVRIRFIGVWDTVDAVGAPFHIADVLNLTVRRFKFPDHYLGEHVDRACQAVSLDDERGAFRPLLWQPRCRLDALRMEQVWFAGVHSNVGGGYPKQGMSLVTFDWMLAKAWDAGLRIVPRDLAFYHEHTNVDDKLYDSRSGLGIFYEWRVRDMAAMCAKKGVAPVVHLSALERIAHGTDDYAPGNLALAAEVAFTPTGDVAKDLAAATRAGHVQAILREAARGERSLLDGVRPSIAIGRASYFVYVATCLAALIAAATPADALTDRPWLHVAWELLKNTGVLVYDVVTLQVGPLFAVARRLAGSRPILAVLLGGVAVSWVLEFLADARMSAVFSGFWHERQKDLRAGLKAARQDARGGGGPR